MSASSKWIAVAATAAGLWTGAAIGQQIISLGDGANTIGVTAGGTTVRGNVLGGPGTWSIAGTSVALSNQLLPAGNTQTASGMSEDGTHMIAVVKNSGGLGGLDPNATMAACWDSTNGWVNLGLLTPDAGLGVTGSSAQSGSISTPRAVGNGGRFVVGQGYIAPGSFRFRGWVWDRLANAGAGKMIVLPTSFDTGANRYRDGRAIAVSQDGSVIVGGENPNTSSGRLMVWRSSDPNTGTWTYSYLPDFVDPNGNPNLTGRTVDSFLINAAGTIIVGTSYNLDPNVPGGVDGAFLARWTWDPNTSVWNREKLGSQPSPEASWRDSSSCPIPPTIFPTGMTEDGKLIVGLVSYSTCGSFIRSSWIYDGRTRVASITDLYDYLNSIGTADLSNLASTGTNIPPRIGTVPDVDPNGEWLAGYGTFVQSSGGPAWLTKLSGTIGCVPPFVTNNPVATYNYSRCSTPILNGGGGGSMAIGYQWLKNGSPVSDGPTGTGSSITGATTTQLRIATPNPTDAGSYTLRVSNACGSPATTSACTVQTDPNVATLANDVCSSAASIGQGTNLFSFSPCGAWYDENIASCSPTFTDTADAWFSFTNTGVGQDFRIESCGANYDTILSIYDGCLGSELSCNNNLDTGPTTGCSSTRSRVRQYVANNQTIKIRVSANGFISSTSVGNISINPAPAIPANDVCSNAATVALGANVIDTTEALNDTIASCSAAASRDLWYTFTSNLDGKLRVATCPGTTWNTVLSVYASCGGSELGCNDNASVTGCSNQSIVANVPVTGGDPVVIRVAGNSTTAFGAGTLTLSLTCNVDQSGNGVVDQDDLDLVLFYFGTSQPAGTNGDVDLDGDVDQDDLDQVLFYFGVSCS